MGGEMDGAGMEEAASSEGSTPAPGRRQVTAALMVAMMVTAMEQLVVSPAMPTIIAQLRGFEIYPWVISAYLLSSTVSTPIYGKLADLFGRKRVLLFGLAMFSAGSMLSGVSQSMGQLIAMRTVQGLGAGAVGPIVLTLLGDLFTLKERARIQGLFSAVWGLSSIGGPLIGGWLTLHLSWRWVFFVSVPFAALAIGMIVVCLHEKVERRLVAPIDWAGAGLLTAGLSALLLIVLDGSELGVGGNLVLGLLTVGLLVSFVFRELRAEDPILPMDLIVRPVIAASVLGNFLVGGILFGLETYVPLFIQGVRGGDAGQAGQALTPLFLAWAVSVAFAARAMVRWGFRRGGMIGAVFISVGLLGLVAGAFDPAWARFAFTIALISVGTGMGLTSLSFILAVQHAVEWGQRGVATGAAIFFRTIGGAIGVGLLGGALAWRLGRLLAAAGARGVDVAAALRPEEHHTLPPGSLALVQDALGQSLCGVYVLIAALGVGTLLCSACLPGRASATTKDAATEERELESLDGDLAAAASEV
ncbi:Multidrug resistance protein 3 [Aquisphaera giovannonii]|uniref:Multidrug resistance protein 3 n=1 Tax=Aquisphaera giovannonii TaxID=406548 RepID=A0A5B9WAI8_9BACT|nr:MDR family MFS transporter [Aquisphaera giovannonii]QEH37041.1 Multidrug resistance protein 3 [Aquisphaera giovannonii]